jgi:hypothetical protein
VTATLRPSGEQLQWMSDFVVEIARTGSELDGAPGAGVSMRQIFSSVKLRT